MPVKNGRIVSHDNSVYRLSTRLLEGFHFLGDRYLLGCLFLLLFLFFLHPLLFWLIAWFGFVTSFQGSLFRPIKEVLKQSREEETLRASRDL